MNKQLILIILIFVSLAMIGIFFISQFVSPLEERPVGGNEIEQKTAPDFPSTDKRAILPDQGLSKEDVTISVYETEYHHDETIFEPAEFTIANNTLNSIFFYTGCAVQFPYIFKGTSQERITVPSSQPVCTAEPGIIELSPEGSKSFYWNQASPLGRFLEDGIYRLGIDYSLNKISRFNLGDMETVHSKSFAVKEVVWDKRQQEEICRLYGKEGIYVNDGYYSEENCISRLNRLSK